MSDLNHHLFTGIVPPITLAHPIPTIEEAQARLAQVESECPGSYFWAFGNEEREAQRLAWITRKSAAKMDLDEAIQASKTGWFRNGKRVEVTLKGNLSVKQIAAPAKKPTKRKTPEQFAAQAEYFLGLVSEHEAGSPQWLTLRETAQAYKNRCDARAKAMGVTPPVIVIPPIPAKPKPPTPRKTLEALAERWRQFRANGDRVNEGKAAKLIRDHCTKFRLNLPAA